MDDAKTRASIGARRNPETEAAVLDAAQAIIAEEGFARLTMEAVARRARAGKATVYRWWPSRGHLLLALYSRAKAGHVLPDTGSLRGDLQDYLGQMLAHWRGDHGPAAGPLLRLLIAEAQMDDTVRAALTAERRTNWHHIDTILFRARVRGEVNPTLPEGRAEQKVISLPWYLLLVDELPTPAETPALIDAIIAGLAG